MSIDDLQAQLRGALDQQFAALKQQYEQAIADVRRQAAVDADRETAGRIEKARGEWESALASILEATRAETRQQAEESARAQRNALEQQLQKQLEQSVQHAVNSVRKTTELEIDALRRRVDEDVRAERQRGQAALEEERERLKQAVDAERQRAMQELDAERARARTELETVQELLEAEIAGAKAEAAAAQETVSSVQAESASANEALASAQAALASTQNELASAQNTLASAQAAGVDASARAAAAESDAAAARAEAAAAAAVPAAPSAPAALARVPDAIREIDSAKSLSQTLEAVLAGAGALAGRAALFLINGDRLKSWKTVAIPEIDVQTVESSIGGRDLLARAVQTGQAMPASELLPAPPFARLSANRPAVAVPLMINGRAVAVLYADAGHDEPAAGWVEGVELIARHASAIAALRAAMRTLDVLRGDAPDASLPAEVPTGNGNAEESARRYARLLVSEIKLYNEGAVRAGRQQRDLRQRLRSEIDRALRLYEERVPPALGARDQYFQQELVQTLADGDPSLLGN